MKWDFYCLHVNCYFNTCTQLWLTESEQATPVDSIKDLDEVLCRFPSSTNTWRRPRTYRPKSCGNNIKDEDNCPKTLNDKNHQASSQKFKYLFWNNCQVLVSLSILVQQPLPWEFFNVRHQYFIVLFYYETLHNQKMLLAIIHHQNVSITFLSLVSWIFSDPGVSKILIYNYAIKCVFTLVAYCTFDYKLSILYIFVINYAF